MSSVDDPAATVLALLAAAGLHPSEEEVTAFIAMYPELRNRADRLFLLEDRDPEIASDHRATDEAPN